MNNLNDIPHDGHCIMLDGHGKIPMTASEASRKASERGLYHYECKYCGMHHFSSERKPRNARKKKN